MGEWTLKSRRRLSRDVKQSPALSEAGFTALVADHHGDLVRLAYAMVGDPELANDVDQSTWTAAWRNRSRLREPDKIRGWLLTITAKEARLASSFMPTSFWRMVRPTAKGSNGRYSLPKGVQRGT